MEPIAERFGLDPEEVMENVVFARARTSDDQMKLLLKVIIRSSLSYYYIYLLIIDNINDGARALFCADCRLSYGVI